MFVFTITAIIIVKDSVLLRLKKKKMQQKRTRKLYKMAKKGKFLSLVAQMVKNLPAMQEIQVWSLGQEDPLEKEVAKSRM